MNSTIKQFAEQARQYAEDEQNNPLKIYTLDCFNEKFAELIVRECANMFDKDEMELTFTKRTIHNMIKEHFGIKE